MKFFVIVLLVGCLISQLADAFRAKTTTLPKEFKLCKIGDDVCLLDAVSGGLKLLKNGIPKLGGISIDPIHVTELQMNHGSGPVSVKLKFIEMDFLGLGQLELSSVKGIFGDKDYRVEMTGHIPAITLYGDYTIDGKILLLPVRGAGKENITLANISATVVVTGHVVYKEGVEYVLIDNATVDIQKVSRMYTNLGNLFDGDQRLGDGMNVFLNENWEEVLKDVKPVAEEGLGQVFKELAFRLYDRVPYRKIHSF